MHIALFTSGGSTDHIHVEEDISSQVDGYRLTFNTSQEYDPGSLTVIYNGVSYRPGTDNDFIESGPMQFTFPFDGYGPKDLFPPKLGCSALHVTYRLKLDIPGGSSPGCGG